MNEVVINIRSGDDRDVVAARRAVRAMARDVGFGIGNQTRLATAVSELVRNVIQHADNGTCTIVDISNPATIGVRVIVRDNGPGIDEVDRALEDYYSTSGGLGQGLPSVLRIVHHFEINSNTNGTTVTIAIQSPRPGEV